jgi:CheY-like chemotaxis protein/predicted regulator of Ras-like GTPase activity (Roadblock/LC7/MglB family)
MAQYSILIADDDPNTLDLLSSMLRDSGFRATGVASGVEALDFYERETPDIVLADLAMPEMSGLQLLDELKKYDPLAKVIIITAYGDKEAVARAFRMGALEFLEKPLDPRTLIPMLRDLLEREDRALAGDLEMMSLASIIQINCEERNQALLILNHQGEEGQIFFKGGEIVHAETGQLFGDEAVYSLLAWEQGSFRLKMDLEPPRRTINQGWSGLLLEGMRRIDESTAGWRADHPQEEEKPAKDPKAQLQERVVKALGNIRDIQSAMLCGMDGTIIAQVKSDSPESDLNLADVTHQKANVLGGFLDGGALERVVLSGSKRRVYLQPKEDYLILLNLTKRASAETVWESVQTIYKRYQS